MVLPSVLIGLDNTAHHTFKDRCAVVIWSYVACNSEPFGLLLSSVLKFFLKFGLHCITKLTSKFPHD